jgi:LMBR1 domain-containing protein 1
LTPFRIILGFTCLALSLITVGSIAITNVDRLLNSECGLSCGYVIEKYTLFNPLDYVLVELSKYFPLDFLLFGTILFYVFITCLYGLVRLGIKFFCINVSSLKLK